MPAIERYFMRNPPDAAGYETGADGGDGLPNGVPMPYPFPRPVGGARRSPRRRSSRTG